jgi:uracil-DNA glycosylase
MPKARYRTLGTLLTAIRDCRAYAAHLPLGPRPVLRARKTARILIVGQAPGLRVHTTRVPWNDASGARLRAWMGVDLRAVPCSSASRTSVMSLRTSRVVVAWAQAVRLERSLADLLPP